MSTTISCPCASARSRSRYHEDRWTHKYVLRRANNPTGFTAAFALRTKDLTTALAHVYLYISPMCLPSGILNVTNFFTARYVSSFHAQEANRFSFRFPCMKFRMGDVFRGIFLHWCRSP
ncbi:hypothetical protein KP509_04G101700 [Ceratopteris richardii]|uniref:Uncharacterized protein n=1 Tax=Ceratopteris richardii TaxID=49495 RepID=A0A8T2UVQ6_CERRI|nr:hypothetical protein KP509_04G101700 [Ceratopteris richardii]